MPRAAERRVILWAMRRLSLVALVLAFTLIPATAIAGFARDGRYTGRTKQTYGGKRGIIAFSVGHSGNRMAKIRMNLLYRCPKLGRYPTTLAIRGTFVGKQKGTFSQNGSFRTRGPFGRQARVQIRFAGRFAGRTYARGAVDALMSVLRGGKVVDRCAVQTNFYARRR